ncbi:MAG: 50S ribosomal protein L22 [Bdellovibrionota bacterium]
MGSNLNNSVSTATLRGVRISPRKLRLVADLIRGKNVSDALQILAFMPKKAAKITSSVLKSAIANARNNSNIDIDDLVVEQAYVDMGRTLRRFMPRARGVATRIRKRSSHLTISLGTH